MKEEYDGRMATETLHKKLFTVEEFMRVSEAGVFPPEGRFELIRGEILEVPPPDPQHAGRVDRLTRILSRALGDAFIVSVQNPAALDNFSQPMPDLKVLKFRPDFYVASHPGPRDILLAIEVSDTTMEYDVNVKAPLYADAGIPEYWIVDITNDRLLVHTHP